jgi:hypothetical protein
MYINKDSASQGILIYMCMYMYKTLLLEVFQYIYMYIYIFTCLCIQDGDSRGISNLEPLKRPLFDRRGKY